MLEPFDRARARPGSPSPPFRSRCRASTRMSLTSELLPRAGDAGDADEQPERNLDVDVLQVVVRRAEDLQPLARRWAALRRESSICPLAREILARSGCASLLATSSGVPCATDFAAAHAGAGAEVDDVVGGPHRVFVVLDDDDRVAHVAQAVRAWRAAGRCRAGAGRSKARRGCRARRPARSRSGRPGECAAIRRRKASARCGRASGIRARRSIRKPSRPRISLSTSAAMMRARGVELQLAEELGRVG